jgi:hypothetical protein
MHGIFMLIIQFQIQDSISSDFSNGGAPHSIYYELIIQLLKATVNGECVVFNVVLLQQVRFLCYKIVSPPEDDIFWTKSIKITLQVFSNSAVLHCSLTF